MLVRLYGAYASEYRGRKSLHGRSQGSLPPQLPFVARFTRDMIPQFRAPFFSCLYLHGALQDMMGHVDELQEVRRNRKHRQLGK